MKKISFRTVILITLVASVGTISFSSFYMYNQYLSRLIHMESVKNAEFERDIVSKLELLKDQFYYSIDEHDGSILKTLLQRMDTREQVLNSYLFDSGGKMVYSMKADSLQLTAVSAGDFPVADEGIRLKSYPLAENPFSRACFQMDNAPSCHTCHPEENASLGYVVIDFALSETMENTAFIHRSSLFFSLGMILVLGIFIVFVHYRFVRKSLRQFRLTIAAINNGDLDKRLSIPETRELGELGKNFNSMVDTFQKAQKELMEFHRKELRSNYKLATIGEMSARLAHEIRNPLTGIANAIDIIVRETRDEENIPVFEEIKRQTGRVNNAITDLLKYARKKDLNLSENNINEVIEPMVFFLKNQVKNKAISFNLDLQEDIPPFRFDQMQIEDVLLNLGINAIHAIPDNGTVVFRTAFSKADERVHIEVTDSGKGIAPEDLDRIFHPFFTTRNEGTGLGLAIVKEIVDKHGGEIWAENNDTAGSTFTVSLPAGRD